MKNLIIILTLSLSVLPSHALFYLNGYGQLSVGSFDESPETLSGGGTLDHDGQTYGLGLGARVGLSFMFFTAGVVGEIQKQQYEGEREDGDRANGFDGDEDYDNSVDRSLYGAFFIFDPPVIPVYFIGEYYPSINGKMHYSENRGENPFKKGDKISGSGFGLGVGFGLALFDGKLILRKIKYDEFTLSGVKTTLPSSRFQEFEGWEASIQAGIAVDLL